MIQNYYIILLYLEMFHLRQFIIYVSIHDTFGQNSYNFCHSLSQFQKVYEQHKSLGMIGNSFVVVFCVFFIHYYTYFKFVSAHMRWPNP